MKFNLHILADHMKKCNPFVSAGAKTDFTLKQVCIMNKNAQCKEDTAYLLQWERKDALKQQNAQSPLSFIIICPEENLECREYFEHLPKQWNLLALRSKQHLKIIYQEPFFAE